MLVLLVACSHRKKIPRISAAMMKVAVSIMIAPATV